ncbi:MAG: VOC family protein [Candidatus Limnocylindrales bacterium]
MLADHPAHATLPASDLTRARAFYENVLGFEPQAVMPDRVIYGAGGGTTFLVFRSAGRAAGSHTQVGFTVTDLDAQVHRLKERGVRFEAYDVPGFDPRTSIATNGPSRSAWFRDTEGNVIGLVSLGARA